MARPKRGIVVEAPDGLLFDKNHMWVRKDGDIVTVGWTRHAVMSAGDVSYLVLPRKGERIEAGKDFGSVETGKWVGRFASPVSGEVVEQNDRVVRDPGALNDDPFGDGWLLRVKFKGSLPKGLLDAKGYTKFVKDSEG